MRLTTLLYEDDVRYDPFGTALSWHFAVADLLYADDPSNIPDAWQFRPSPFGPDTDDWRFQELDGMLTAGQITAADLVRFGNVLARYVNVCRLAGRDY